MTIEVYIWDTTYPNRVGHSSMALSDKTYISWWPKTGIPVTGVQYDTAGRPADSFKNDITDKGRPAEKIIQIPVGYLDERKIKHWWEDFKKAATYNLLKLNCGHAVYKALYSGGATRNDGLPGSPVTLPKQVGRYAMQLKKEAERYLDEEM